MPVAAGQSLQRGAVFVGNPAQIIGVPVAQCLASRHPVRIVIEQQLQNAKARVAAERTDVDPAHGFDQGRQIIDIDVATALLVQDLGPHHVGGGGQIPRNRVSRS